MFILSLILGLIMLVGFAVWATSEGSFSKAKMTLGVVLSLGVIVLGGLFSTFTTVQTGERGVLLVWGKYERTLGEGFHMVNSITSEIVIMPVRITKLEASASAASKDLQTVTSVVALNYHPEADKVGSLYQKIGKDYENAVIVPAIQESVKAASAKYTAEELISKRESVKNDIKTSLTDRLIVFGVIVDDFSIINFDFSANFNAAIEAKVTAEQQALEAKNQLEKVKFEAQQSIEKAKAESESTRLQVEALKQGAQVIELRKVEAMLEAAKRWDGKLPVNLFSGGSPVPLLNVNEFLK